MYLNRSERRRQAALRRRMSRGSHTDQKQRKTNLAAGPITAAALMLAAPGVAQAQVVTPASPQCVVAGTTVTCTGDLSGGVDVDGPPVSTLDTLIINMVDPPGITPAAGIDGVNFTNAAPGNITIDVDTTGTSGITTTGLDADGIAVLSGGAGDITITSVGPITTTGIDADAIQVDNYGGGDVTITSTGDLTTSGATSYGVYVYNEGGFTGSTSVTSNGNITLNGPMSIGIAIFNFADGDVTINSTGNIVSNTTPTVGIFGGSLGLTGGNVTIVSSGNINASDDGIYGVVAGNGNVSITSTGNITVLDEEGLDAEVGGDGNIFVSNTGTVSSYDEAIDTTINGPTGGDITIINNGNLISADGTGIDADIVNGSGTVSITTTGDITATSATSDGIYVYNGAAGATTININGGTIQGGTGTGAGIYLAGSAAPTTITVTGTTSISAGSGNAILGGTGNTTINNSGIFSTITNGAIILGGGVNAFNNFAGATFNSGGIVNLGAGNLFTNAGILSPGGLGSVATTAITGNFLQTTSGTLLADLDLTASTSDLVNVTGTATLSGNVQLNVINPAFGLQQQTVLSAAGGVSNAGLNLVASPVLQAELLFPNANDVVVQTNLSFAPAGSNLNQNQISLGNNLNAIVAAGGGGVTAITDAITNNITSDEELAAILDQLGAESFLSLETTTFFSSLNFANSLLSCKEADGVFAAISEGQCAWFQPHGRFLDRDQTAENIGFDEQVGGFATGAQFALSETLSFGFGFGYETGNFDTTSGVDGDFDRFQGGLAVKYQKDALLLAASVSGGSSQNDLTRSVTLGGLSLFPESEPDVSFVTFQSRFGYLFEKQGFSIKPLLDLSLTQLDLDGVTETGGGAANLTTSGDRDLYFAASPSLEISRDFDLDNGFSIRTFADLGFTVFSEDSHAQTASFVAAPGVGAFAVSTELDRIFGEVDAGATFFSEKGHSLTLRYQGRFSDETQIHGGQLRASFRF